MYRNIIRVLISVGFVFFIAASLASFDCFSQDYHPELKYTRYCTFWDASPYSFHGRDLDGSWRSISFSTHTDNGYNYFYYDNVFCKNRSTRYIYVGITYVLRKTKRRLFGGLDYTLDGAIIAEEQYAGCVIPPNKTVGLIPSWEEVITNPYTRNDRGIEVTSITCQYAD